jgi:hypothetical protein
MAENLLLKQQLIIVRRARQRAPNLTRSDRLLCGFWSLFLSPERIRKVAIALRPSTLLTFHQALVRCKYRRLFSSTSCPRKPGPKGPDQALIHAIVELKSRNPRFGCPRIARIIAQTFGIDIDKNVVYRVLSKHYRPAPGGTGPSWLSFIGHTIDSLWSVDLFRCESIVLRSYWVLVVNLYLSGFTTSPNFPTMNALYVTPRGGVDAVFAKISPVGDSLIYSTYFGGSGEDRGDYIAVDPTGNAYFCGWTGSLDFPTTPGAFQPMFGGPQFDAFVVKFADDRPTLH